MICAQNVDGFNPYASEMAIMDSLNFKREMVRVELANTSLNCLAAATVAVRKVQKRPTIAYGRVAAFLYSCRLDNCRFDLEILKVI